MICTFIYLALMFFSCGNQINDTLPQSIKEIWIYDYFHQRGYTTAGAYGQIIRLKEQNTPKFKLEQNDVDSLCRIMRETSTGKLFHTKWGVNILFAEIILKNGQKSMAFIGRYGISVDIVKKNYWIKNEKSQKWLDEFMDRIWKEQPCN